MRDKRSLSQNSPQESQRKRHRAGPAPAATSTLRLKIQRLRGDDFFISIRRKDLITQLKQEVLRILHSAPGPEICVEITSIRLIYKGKLLADEKSIEFYQIQNEDTIQLVPIRRSRSSRHTETEAQTQGTSNRQERPEPNEVTRDINPISFISFSTSFIEEPSRNENRRASSIRYEPRRAVYRGRRFMPRSSRRQRRPVTLSSLCSFKDVLVRTHLRVHAAEQQMRRGGSCNEQRALLSLLPTLISQSRDLRNDLLADLQSISSRSELPTAFQATSENGVFSIVSRQQSAQGHNRVAPMPSTDDEKTQSHPEEEKDHHSPRSAAPNSSRQQSRPGTPSFVLFRNTEINIPVNPTRSQIQLNLQQSSGTSQDQRRFNFSQVSPSTVNGGRGIENVTIVSNSQGREQRQTHVNTLSPRRLTFTIPDHTSTAPSPQQSSEEANHRTDRTTTGSRIRNIFSQFLNRFIN